MNQVQIMGNITGKVTNGFAEDGKPYVLFTVTVTSPDGQNDALNCVAWGKTAVCIGQYVNHGDTAVIAGKFTPVKQRVNGATVIRQMITALEFERIRRGKISAGKCHALIDSVPAAHPDCCEYTASLTI